MERTLVAELLLDSPSLAAAIAEHNSAGPLLCEHCGQSTNQRCSACKAVAYCSASCQHKDWILGHIEECAAISAKLPWDTQSVIGAVLLDRHADRLEEIGRGGHSGGGGGGWGRGGWGRGGGGWGRGYGRGWGYGYGYPWLLYSGLWYPWWFNIPPSYYASQQPYPGYGVPPYPPQNWGNVPPPTPGQQGYAQLPAGERIVPGHVTIPDHKVLNEDDLIGLPFGKPSNSRFLEDQVLLTVDLTRAIVGGQVPDTEPLKENAKKWTEAMVKDRVEQQALIRVVNEQLAATQRYIAARIVNDTQQLEAARNSLMGPIAERWADFWVGARSPPKGMNERRFRAVLMGDAKQYVTNTASFVEDIVRGSQKEAVASIREATKHARQMGKLLDETQP
jgi:hypothetical protein